MLVVGGVRFFALHNVFNIALFVEQNSMQTYSAKSLFITLAC